MGNEVSASESTKIFALKNALNIIHFHTAFVGVIINNKHIEIPFGEERIGKEVIKGIRSLLPTSWNIEIGQNSIYSEWRSILITSSQF